MPYAQTLRTPSLAEHDRVAALHVRRPRCRPLPPLHSPRQGHLGRRPHLARVLSPRCLRWWTARRRWCARTRLLAEHARQDAATSRRGPPGAPSPPLRRIHGLTLHPILCLIPRPILISRLISSSPHAASHPPFHPPSYPHPHPHLIPSYLILISSSPHPHLILISSSPHPHLILTSSSSHPHLILISSASHPHLILTSSASHPHLILTSSSSHPHLT
jgi:hypothetical protein